MIFLATVVAMVGVAAGTGMANLLTTHSVNQTADFYQGGNNGVPNWPAPTLSVGFVPTITACTGTSATDVEALSSPPAAASIYLASSGSGGTCATGDFAEVFTFSFITSNTSVVSSETLTVTTEVGGSSTLTSNSAAVTFTTPASGSGPFLATLDVYVDYGTVNAPSDGIAILDIIVQ